MIIRHDPAVPPPLELLPSILSHLGEHTLIEFKSPTDDLEADDVQLLLSYAHQYTILEKPGVRRRQVQLMTVSDHLTASFRQRVEEYDGRLMELEAGIWRVDGLSYRLYCIETGVVSDRDNEHLLYPFSRRFLKEPGRMLSRLRPAERALFMSILQQVQQSKGSPELMALKDADWLNKTEEELLQQLLSTLRLEQRLQGLTAEEVLKRFSAEERLKGLPAEERLKGLPAEERLRGVPAEERLQGLDAETLARSLDPETLARLKQLLH